MGKTYNQVGSDCPEHLYCPIKDNLYMHVLGENMIWYLSFFSSLQMEMME